MTGRQRIFFLGLTIILVLGIPLLSSSLFVVNEREMAVVVRFGEPVASYTEPGLGMKLPWIDEVRRLPKTLQFWVAGPNEVLVDLPTSDGKKIEVTPWAAWRISDPQRFLEVLVTVENAGQRVQTVVRGEVRDIITNNTLAEVVRSTDRKLTYSFHTMSLPAKAPAAPPSPVTPPAVEGTPPGQFDTAERIQIGREKIVALIQQTVQTRLARPDHHESSPPGGEPADTAGLGIELVDAGIARIDFVHDVQIEAFKRQIAFMESIAAQNTSEGERRKQEILNRTEEEVQRILGEGKQQASITRGKVEAEIIESYATAIREAGDFYTFVRTLEVYEQALPQGTRLILSTKSPLLRLMREGPGSPPAPQNGQ